MFNEPASTKELVDKLCSVLHRYTSFQLVIAFGETSC
jgi:hypothetical protein